MEILRIVYTEKSRRKLKCDTWALIRLRYHFRGVNSFQRRYSFLQVRKGDNRNPQVCQLSILPWLRADGKAKHCFDHAVTIWVVIPMMASFSREGFQYPECWTACSSTRRQKNLSRIIPWKYTQTLCDKTYKVWLIYGKSKMQILKPQGLLGCLSGEPRVWKPWSF